MYSCWRLFLLELNKVPMDAGKFLTTYGLQKNALDTSVKPLTWHNSSLANSFITNCCLRYDLYMFSSHFNSQLQLSIRRKIEKVPRGIQGENLGKDTASSGKLVSTNWSTSKSCCFMEHKQIILIQTIGSQANHSVSVNWEIIFGYNKLLKTFETFVGTYLALLLKFGTMPFQEYISIGTTYSVFDCDLIWKQRRVSCTANFISSWLENS